MGNKKGNDRSNHNGDEDCNRNRGGKGRGHRRREKYNITGIHDAQEGKVVSGSGG